MLKEGNRANSFERTSPLTSIPLMIGTRVLSHKQNEEKDKKKMK